MKNKEVKVCIVCNKTFQNRKKWKSRNQFSKVKYCSQRCRNKNKNHEKRQN